MKICIDIQSTVKNPSGVGRYTLGLVKALAEIPEKPEVYLTYFNFLGRYQGLDCFPNKAVRIIPGRVYNQLWKRWHWPPLNWFIGSFDIYHFPNFCLPPLSSPNAQTIITVHDVAFRRYPQYIEPRNLLFLKNELQSSLARSGRIIAVSRFTKNELIELFSVDPGKIAVIYEGVNDGFKKVADKTMDLPAQYMLCLSTLEPRKNIEGLIRGFALCRLNDFKLVIAGARGWLCDGIFELVARLGLEQDVIFTGYVASGQLAELYSRASVFVFPSFYEGFGLPPLEAMACGVPVVSTRLEALGEAARIVDPGNPEDIAAGIKEVLYSPEEYIGKGLEQARKFTWRKTAEETLKLYQSLAA